MIKYKTYEEMTPKERRDYWYRRVKSGRDFIKEAFDKEVKSYLRMYRHQFGNLLPEHLLQSERVDVNVIYPIIKTLIPKLYFQDPKAFVKALQEKIVMPRLTAAIDPMSGQPTDQLIPLTDPMSGAPMVDEYDGPRSALILQNALNHNIRLANLKYHAKLAILDAHIGFYGAIKTGWGLEQGVASMGDAKIISHREDTENGLAYGIRLNPWDVIPDMEDFYNQAFTAVYYCVHPENLKRDVRLKNTERLEGKAALDPNVKRERFKLMDENDIVRTEYYEIYVKPCALYPEGMFLLLSEEIDDDFLYEGPWPHATTNNPIKFLYFNPDPEGGLPVPDVRYYANQQKMKSTLRKVAYEYTLRSLPFVGVDLGSVADKAGFEKALRSGSTPKFVRTDGRKPSDVLQAFSFNNLNPDFYRTDSQVDDDVSRVVGMVKGVYPGSGDNVELASVAKIADQGEQIRQNERADIVRDFMASILTQWVDYFKQYAGPENYTPIEGEKFPVFWSRDMIQMKTDLEIKPFSMNYEDPVIRRRQWVDLLNLLASPAVVQVLAMQGASVDFLKVLRRILETYDERDVETFILDAAAKPENQVARAIMEGFNGMQGVPPVIEPTDNHQLHIMIHDLFTKMGVDMSLHIQEHVAAMSQGMMQKPGGGNAETTTPTKGNAVSQEQMQEPLEPSSQNQEIAVEREATR